LTPDERDAVRKLLIKYQAALSLAEELALSVIDTLQPEVSPPDPAQARERRKAMGDALAMIESGDEYAAGLWSELGLDRRATATPGALPPDLHRDRRRQRRRSVARPKA
jgi:hypothetical protein